MKRYLVFTCFLSIRQIVLKFVPEYGSILVKKIVFVKENSTGTANLHIHNIKLAKIKWTLMCKYLLDFLIK